MNERASTGGSSGFAASDPGRVIGTSDQPNLGTGHGRCPACGGPVELLGAGFICVALCPCCVPSAEKGCSTSWLSRDEVVRS